MDFSADLRRFLDGEGRLLSFPAKSGKKSAALFYLAEKFERGRSYTEAEVNDLLARWHVFDDSCLLRRELYNKRFLNRERDGSRYWLEEPAPAPADFGLEDGGARSNETEKG